MISTRFDKRGLVPWAAVAAWLLLRPATFAEVNGYEWLANWTDLPRAKTGITAGLASSYARSGADDDYNNYQSPEGPRTEDEPVVALEVRGPGVLTRFWMPHQCAVEGFKIRLVIDGQVRVDTTSRAWLGCQYGYFREPLVQTLLGGQVSYEPIVFAKSLRVETENRHAITHYYQYNYLRLRADEQVLSYTGNPTPQQRKARETVATMIRNVGANPAGPCPVCEVLAQPKRTIPGRLTRGLVEPPG